MTPREALELLKAEGHDDHTLWRDPEGKSYLLSRPGSDLHYLREGYIPLTKMSTMRGFLREITAHGVEPGTHLWVLMEDVNKQEGRNQEGGPV